MRYLIPLSSRIRSSGAFVVASAVVCFSSAPVARAAEAHYVTAVNQGQYNPSWATPGIWKLNNAGTAVSATNANSYYEATNNGTLLGNGTATTLLRPPYGGSTPTTVYFTGDSLVVDTNTQIRFKENATVTAGAYGYQYVAPTNIFYGSNGLPGLVLNGGCLNAGTTPSCYTFFGTMQAAPGTLSFLNPGDTFTGNAAVRGFVIGAQLSGSGGIALLNGPSTAPQSVTGTSNSFTGSWIVKAGWLLGFGDGTLDGYNSLGTNTACTFTIDPQWTPPPTFNANAVFIGGPAILDMGTANANCGGNVILTNGGKLSLRSVVAFNSVTIEGTALTPGTHYYSELLTNFANNFSTGGSGALVIRPYNPVPVSLGPVIQTQPLPQMVYSGVTATFTVGASANGAPPLTYQWQRAGTNLVNAANISGATNATLVVSNATAADAVNYDVIVRNGGGSLTSVSVALTIVAPSGEAYETAVQAANPVAFYQLNETGDPYTNNSPVFDYAGGFNGAYGNTVQNGNALYNIAGPRPATGFPGFGAGNTAAQFATGQTGSRVSVLPWNINTNTVTFTAWINPSGVQQNGNALLFVRNGTGVATAGLEYSGGMDTNGNHTLGYNWDDEAPTYNWNSGLSTPPGVWSFVALVITPTNATISVINAQGAVASTHVYNHVPLAFTTTTKIGEDSYDGGNGSRSFNGIIDDVGVFGSALLPSQLLALYSAGAGAAAFPPEIGVQPVGLSLYQGQTAQFTALAAGALPLTYQWQAGATGSGVYTNLTDGGQFSGSGTPVLTITGVDFPNAADYIVVVTNVDGKASSAVANLAVLATNGPVDITLTVQEAAGADWNTTGVWNDGMGGLAASVSAAAFPGSTYTVGPMTMLRTPSGGNPVSVFPGVVLTNSGTGVFTNIATVNGGEPNGLIRLKQVNPGSITNPAYIVFPRLVMAGGQIDAGSDGLAVIQGEMDVVTNAIIYVDSGGGPNRWYQIDAFLNGPSYASVEYHAFDTSLTGDLIITCPTNNYKGTWNIVQGALVGTGTNCLGTNTITIGTNGALETTYDIHNPKGTLLLNGKMFLHQNDSFGSVAINGTPLAPGVYYFTNLATTYSNSFPVTWKAQTGAASYTTGSGSLTVLGLVPPTITVEPIASQTLYVGQTAQFVASVIGGLPLYYQWQAGATGSGVYTNLHNVGTISGATTTNLTISPVDLPNSADYILIVTNGAGAATSTVSTLIVNPTYPAIIPITLAGQEAIGQDWDTTGMWNDGQGGLPASISSVEFPGSTYEVLPGARLRSTDSAATAAFPGGLLTIDGNGVYVNNPGATALVGEFRFKQLANSVATVTVPKLVMNGGQLDLGNDGVVTVLGEIDIVTNTPINNNGTTDRGYILNAWLRGTGSVEYHGYQSAWQSTFANSLTIAGTSNTFSGAWNVVAGTLLGTGTNALGTNSITIGGDGALETLYNLNSPNATLALNGRMYLHQNDTFGTVFVGNSTLAPGTYTFAQLNAAYPSSFPATWTPQNGSGIYTGSGSLTVLNGAISLSSASPVVPLGQNIPVTVSIPAGANSTGPVTVTVVDDNAAVAALPGGNPSLTSVVFAAGATNAQTLTLSTLAFGTAHLTGTAPGLVGSVPLSLFVRHAPTLIGHWTFNDPGNPFAETSGFRPATTHDGTPIGSVVLTNDAPAMAKANGITNSLDFTGGGLLEIINTRSNEANYFNTFDDEVQAGLTVSAWVRLNSTWSTTNWNAFVSKRGDDNAGYQLRRFNYGPDACFTIRGTPGADDPQGGINYEDGNWHLITGVWDGGAGVRSLYVDGFLDSTANVANDFAPMTMAPTNSLVLGGEDRSNDSTGTTTLQSWFYGFLADVRVYNYPLTASQVANLFAPQPTANPDVAATFWNVPVTISPLVNDSDPKGFALTVNSVSPTNGTAIISAKTNVVFTPTRGFAGTAYAGYTITNGNGGSASSVITITVSAPPKPCFVTTAHSGSSLVLAGTNGAPNGVYTLVTSTNAALPLASWTPVLTNVFDATGNFSITNAITAPGPNSFFLIKQ